MRKFVTLGMLFVAMLVGVIWLGQHQANLSQLTSNIGAIAQSKPAKFDYKTRLGLPAASQIYQPKPALSGPHPRYLFPGTPLSQVKQHAKDARYAAYWQSVVEKATKFAQTPPPEAVNLDAEDPLRGYGNQLAWMALAYLCEDAPASKQLYLQGTVRWLNAMTTWGLPRQDLALSTFIFGVATAYDWLYDDLPKQTRQSARQYLIEMTRFMRSPENKGAAQWREAQFTANHNWWNYAALAISAAVLWGEQDSPLTAGEPKVWLDEAMQNFWVVRTTLPADGSSVEGFLYQSYGDRPYLEFATLAEQLTRPASSFLEIEALKNRSTRLYALLPNNTGFLTYADSRPRVFSGAYIFRYYAARFRDREAQLLAQIMEDAGQRYKIKEVTFDWHGLFWFDPSVPQAKLEQQPLSYHWPDLGLYAIRNSWTKPNANLFSFKCGPVMGKTVTETWGIHLPNGHIQPDQGNFSFNWGSDAVIPGAGYARKKLPSNHNLVVFEGRAEQAGKLVGQVGGGGAWFGSRLNRLQRQATVLKVDQNSGYTSYLCDLSGLYWLQDERVPKQQFYPNYHRRITYLPKGAVVVVDRVQTPVPRTFTFRLLTSAQSMAVQENGFQMTIGRTQLPARINDFSPQPSSRSVAAEKIPTWDNQERRVASLTATDRTQAIFAVVLGVEGSEAGIQVTAKQNQITIRDRDRTINLPMD
ncbi:MAG: DUF4962 domain-containing protein [Aphanocapsa sp. GSE-SYN-MK-11-07L]|jgi:hypothetical protein|nr:DUF4962 domain-containing protein [Aphanocapsa sp. GSE-SYN-MK-11-07L]